MVTPAQDLIGYRLNEVSYLRNDEDILALSELMTGLQLVVRDSFGKLATIKEGQKLSSQTCGSVGCPDFSITLHLEDRDNGYIPKGYVRGAWNATAYLFNKVLPSSHQWTEASINKNIEDLKKVVDHLIIAYEKILKLLTVDPQTKANPAFDRIRRQFLEINQTLKDSSDGIRNLLMTYIADRMAQKENKTPEVISQIAVCLETVFRLNADSDFETFCSQRNGDQKVSVIHLFSEIQQTSILLALSSLKADLYTFFPQNEEHIQQLRSLGKLAERIFKLKSHSGKTDDAEILKTVIDDLRYVEGSNKEPGKITYPDGSYWDEHDGLYHYQGYTNETKFTADELLTASRI